jgi:hypothetical protein
MSTLKALPKKQWNRNSKTPIIEVQALLSPVIVVEDTPINRELAMTLAQTLFDKSREPHEVIVWKCGRGQGIFKRTTGHCYG